MVCYVLAYAHAYTIGACYIGYTKPGLYHMRYWSIICLSIALVICWSVTCLSVALYVGAYILGDASIHTCLPVCVYMVWILLMSAYTVPI